MAEHDPERLIERLAGSLEPVERLAPPWQRAALWLGGVLWLGLVLMLFADLPALGRRMMGTPDLGLALAGESLTAALAAWAAFATSVPGSGRFWVWLPLPGLLLWVGSSTAGCLRGWAAPGTVAEPPMHPMVCAYTLLMLALPLAAGMVWLLRQGFPVRVGVTAGLAGLASAGAAAALLTLVHPFDASAEDLLAHAVAVAVILGVVQARRRMLRV